MWTLISVGLFHSVMFPTIFTLGIRGLGPLTQEGARLLIMAIAGGALVVPTRFVLSNTCNPPSLFIPSFSP